MTATLHFIRHAAHHHLGRTLSGRMPGLPLTAVGRAEAAALAEHLATGTLAAIYTSPVQRARDTAAAIAVRTGLVPVIAAELDEIDFAAWTGRSFAALEGDPAWDRWNSERGSARVPGGETMAEAQARATALAETLARRHDGETIALVSHCDVIRAVLAGYLGLPLDRMLAFDIDPASISRVTIDPWGVQVRSINERAASPPPLAGDIPAPSLYAIDEVSA